MAQGTAMQQGQATMESNINNHTQSGLDSSEKLLSRLGQFRDKLSGEQNPPDPNIKATPKGILQVASTVHSNITVAHKILDEIEQLLG